jgi:hypothetical protein
MDMTDARLLKSLPGDENHHHFTDFVGQLYDEGCQRHFLGNDPNETHLKGCYTLVKDGKTLGRFAFYENPELRYENQQAACIGSFECIDDPEVSQALIDYAKELARLGSNAFLIGPMEGSTWNNYRFSDHNAHPNFFMEPFHNEYYGRLFEGSGFEPIAQYYSHIDANLTYDAAQISGYEKHFREKGARLRKIDLTDLENELLKIARFSNEAFKHNFLFTPIDESDFVRKYSQLEKYFNPELIWIVEDERSEIHAISFSIEDYKKSAGNTVIIKSLARKKDSPFRGIGEYLGIKTVQIAAEAGYDGIIHALMIKNKDSIRLSENHAGTDYKSYSLYGMKL